MRHAATRGGTQSFPDQTMFRLEKACGPRVAEVPACVLRSVSLLPELLRATQDWRRKRHTFHNLATLAFRRNASKPVYAGSRSIPHTGGSHRSEEHTSEL